MTGAGTTSVCWTREPGFLESPVDPTYVHAGRNVSVNDIELSNALERSRLPDDNEAVESIAAVADGGTATDWSLYDIDLTSVAMVDVRAQLEFAHPTDGLFDLDVSLQRGQESLLVEIPEGETGPIPSGLESWLELIVSASAVDPQPSKGLVSRKEVRR